MIEFSGSRLWFVTLFLFGTGLAGCASTPENVILLPDPEGQSGRLQIVAQDQSTVELERPYQSAELLGSRARVVQLDRQNVEARYGATLAVQPPALQRFTLYFREGTDMLTEASARDFTGIPATIAARPVPDVVIVGHTDTVGRQDDNDRLSLKRAEKVREILVKAGVQAENIQVAGRGERELLIATPDETPEPRNRRVDILVR